MNWNQLRYVVTVADERSITRAAEKLYLSQPSLSLSIKSLEQELGLALFQRDQGSLKLTYAGELFYQWANTVLRSYTQLNLKLADIAGGRRCLLRVGISPHRSSILMPTILERFYEEHPACEVRLIEQPTHVRRRLLEERELDVIIDTPHPDTASFVSELLAEEEIILAVPQRFARQLPASLRDAVSLPLESLSDFQFILLGHDQVLGSLSRQACEASGFQPDVRLTCVGVENALGLVCQQLGVTFVPEIFSSIPQFAGGVHYYRIQGMPPRRQMCLVYPRNSYQNQHLRGLMALFRELVPTLYAGWLAGLRKNQ